MVKQTTVTNVPNVVMWAWMRTVLNLTGSELLIFAYIFSQTFDDLHKCYTCQADMEKWFGITRQTVSRNIDNLCAKGYVEKEVLQDSVNPMIKHNNYKVCVSYITKLCEKSDYDSYSNFLDSYAQILKQKFPEDSTTIDEYLQTLSAWHKNKDIKVCVTLNEIAQLITSSEDNSPIGISDMLNQIRERNNTLKKHSKRQFIEKTTPIEKDEPKTTGKGLFDSVKPKRKSKKTLQAEWDVDKRSITHNFIYFRVGGNEELNDLLNKFLDTENGKSYTPAQWQQQLDNMFDHGRTVERMIAGVKNSYMNNYRTLYIVDKSEVEIDEKFMEIDVYVNSQCDGNEELRDLLKSYVTDVSKGKSCTLKQFKIALRNLSTLCPTVEEKVKSVENSYANSYSSLAYPKSFNSDNSNVSNAECEMEEKKNVIKQFIADGYYYLCDDIEDSLLSYITTTQNGITMSASTFKIMLDNLRIYCFDDNEKVSKIKLAIQNNATKFATEDFAESKRLKDRLQTREQKARQLDAIRRTSIAKEMQKHPDNPKIKGVKV